jgi:hypothetical protein
METILPIVVLGLIGVGGYQFITASKADSAEAKTVKSLPPSTRHVVAQMDSVTQTAFFNEYESKRKKTSIAYLCWMLCGVHYLYLNKLLIQVLFWSTLGGVGMWWLYNLFFMKSQVNSVNEQIARECVQTLHMGAAFSQGGYQAPTIQSAQAVPEAPQPLLAQQQLSSATPAPPQQGHWAPDPHGRFEQRYWDGTAWTEHVISGGTQSTDPV